MTAGYALFPFFLWITNRHYFRRIHRSFPCFTNIAIETVVGDFVVSITNNDIIEMVINVAADAVNAVDDDDACCYCRYLNEYPWHATLSSSDYLIP